MSGEFSVSVMSVDDIPFLYSIIEDYKVGSWLDHHLSTHGNWLGASPGTILSVWLCYLLTEQDHRLSPVESWVSARLPLLQCLTGSADLRSLDFTDDKLAHLLGCFSKEALWDSFIVSIERDMLSVYRATASTMSGLPTFRIDSASMQSYGQPSESGLLQYGHAKHHQKTPQAKVKLCTLDNIVNNFAHPVCSLTVSGNTADDVLYIPIIEKLIAILTQHPLYTQGNLLVGDKKFGSLENRVFVVKSGNYYLCPLSIVQLNQQSRTEAIEKALKNPETLLKAYRKPDEPTESTNPKHTPELLARGFRQKVPLRYVSAKADGQEEVVEWEENPLFVHSVAFAAAQAQKLEEKLTNIEQQLDQLLLRKQGKSVPCTLEACQAAIAELLSTANLEHLIEVKVEQIEETRQVRAYKNKPDRTETVKKFVLTYQRNQDAIEQHKQLLGWQVYATNTEEEQLNFETCVQKYRQQTNIESHFDDMRNRIVPLLPLYLHKDTHIIGLVNLITLARKVCSVIEYKIAEALYDQKRAIEGLYDGNPKRKTDKPSIKRILKAFRNIYLTSVYNNGVLMATTITPLNKTQHDLLTIAGKSNTIYTQLANKVQIYFSG